MILAGGTGGHIFPGLAVAEVLRARGVDVTWLGSAHGPENRWVPAADIRLERLTISGLRRSGFKGWLAAPLKLGRAIAQARRILRAERPDSVLALGGFAAGPGGLAAWRERIPLIVHEQNAVPGLTSKTLARVARTVLTAFPGVLARATVVGNPVRAAISALPPPSERFAERAGARRLLVLGGSQGAQSINAGLAPALALIAPDKRPQVLHQAGAGKREMTIERYRSAGVEAEVCEFIGDIAEAYGWADLVVARAGALTLAELAAAGVGAVLIPYRFAADDHQMVNARHFVAAGAAEMLREEALDAAGMAVHLQRLLTDRSRLLTMAEAAAGLAIPDAAERIADACLAS